MKGKRKSKYGNVFTIWIFMIKNIGEWMESEEPGLNPEGG
jgi:hypothetical protein